MNAIERRSVAIVEDQQLDRVRSLPDERPVPGDPRACPGDARQRTRQRHNQRRQPPARANGREALADEDGADPRHARAAFEKRTHAALVETALKLVTEAACVDLRERSLGQLAAKAPLAVTRPEDRVR